MSREQLVAAAHSLLDELVAGAGSFPPVLIGFIDGAPTPRAEFGPYPDVDDEGSPDLAEFGDDLDDDDEEDLTWRVQQAIADHVEYWNGYLLGTFVSAWGADAPYTGEEIRVEGVLDGVVYGVRRTGTTAGHAAPEPLEDPPYNLLHPRMVEVDGAALLARFRAISIAAAAGECVGGALDADTFGIEELDAAPRCVWPEHLVDWLRAHANRGERLRELRAPAIIVASELGMAGRRLRWLCRV